VTDAAPDAAPAAKPAAARASLRERFRAAVEPRATGLPNWRVVTWFPALVTLGASLLIALRISGTSAGAWWATFGTGADPRLLLGGPRPIRQDEWLTAQGWITSQIEQGFPVINRVFPGGMDATVLMELPSTDWSTAFRPHLWGFLLFGLDAGTAWQWWIPAIALVSGAYLLVVTLVPRRPLTAAVVACAVWFSPMFQWWYGPNQLWPTAWALLAMAGLLWILRDDRLWVRLTWSALLGWLAVTAVIGLYVPFLVPPLLVFLFFALGAVAHERPWNRVAARRVFGRLAPLLAAGAAAGAVVVLWVVTRASTIDAVTSTVYPGERSDPTGRLLAEDPFLTGIGGAPWGQTFQTSAGSVLGPNPSESAAAILLAVFLIPGMIWMLVQSRRRTGRLDLVLVGALGALLVMLAYLLVPGWDSLARLLLLDRVPVGRLRMVFVTLMPLFFALIAREVDAHPDRRRWVPMVISLGLTVTLIAIPLQAIATLDPDVLAVSVLWPIAALAIIASVVLIYWPRTIPLSAVSLLVASMAIGAAVNPFYVGSFDLRETQAGAAMLDVDDAEPGEWVGVGSQTVAALVVATGVSGYNGFQTYPADEMWQQIDPDGGDEGIWNRLAHVRWTWGSGEPVFEAPQRDMIVGGFDACSDFAQEHIEYVVSDEQPASDACLRLLETIEQGAASIQLYAVTPRGGE
jgi:hypothetical protein